MHFYSIIKIFISAIIVYFVSEFSKHNSFLGGLLASIPIISILSLLWLYQETQNIDKIISLSHNIFILVIPSLVLFISLPYFLKTGCNFYLSMFYACLSTIICYYIALQLLKIFNINC